jgi:hypothetical protein
MLTVLGEHGVFVMCSRHVLVFRTLSSAADYSFGGRGQSWLAHAGADRGQPNTKCAHCTPARDIATVSCDSRCSSCVLVTFLNAVPFSLPPVVLVSRTAASSLQQSIRWPCAGRRSGVCLTPVAAQQLLTDSACIKALTSAVSRPVGFAGLQSRTRYVFTAAGHTW